MSVRDVKSFFEKVEVDKKLQAKLKALDQKQKKAMDAAIDEMIKIGKSEGFTFTVQDLIEVNNEKVTLKKGEDTTERVEAGCYVAYYCTAAHPLWSDNYPHVVCSDTTQTAYYQPS